MAPWQRIGPLARARGRGTPGAALSNELALGVMRSMACWPTSFGPRFCASGLTSDTPNTSLILSVRLGGCAAGKAARQRARLRQAALRCMA
jgi:hypothetical protein